MKRPEVVVVGSFVRDLTWRCASFPRPGETVLGEFAGGPGGKGSNQAVAAARAGASVCFVGAVGRDALAAEARRFYREEGIAARWIEKRGLATGTAGILVSDRGENEIVVALGANRALAAKDVGADLLRGARVVVCQFESNLAATAAVLRRARRAGAITVLNPAPMREDFSPALLRDVDILIPNETEFLGVLRRLTRTPRLRAGASARRARGLHVFCRTMGVPTVVVTLGARGCLISRPDGFVLLPAHRVEAVDTTGAGDAFVGAFAAGLVRSGGDVMAAAAYGNAAAALAVTRFGTAPAMPREEEIRRFLRKQKSRRAKVARRL